jgi:hypothetical protein
MLVPIASLQPPASLPGAAVVLFALLIGHAVADFALQGAFLSAAKNRHHSLRAFFGEKEVPKGLWIEALSAHSLIHAGAVWWVTGSVGLGLLEFVAHAGIDFAKCEGWTSFRIDQALHVGCKLVWVGLLWGGSAWVMWQP